LKLTTPKAPGTSEKKAPAKAAKPKADRKKSKAAVSEDEVVEEEVKEPEKELDPAEAKAKKEKEGIFAAAHVQTNAYTPYSSLSTTQTSERLFGSRSGTARKRNGHHVEFHWQTRKLRRPRS